MVQDPVLQLQRATNCLTLCESSWDLCSLVSLQSCSGSMTQTATGFWTARWVPCLSFRFYLFSLSAIFLFLYVVSLSFSVCFWPLHTAVLRIETWTLSDSISVYMSSFAVALFSLTLAMCWCDHKQTISPVQMCIRVTLLRLYSWLEAEYSRCKPILHFFLFSTKFLNKIKRFSSNVKR